MYINTPLKLPRILQQAFAGIREIELLLVDYLGDESVYLTAELNYKEWTRV